MDKFRTIDKELEKFIEKEKQVRWLNLMLALCQMEKELGIDIKEFSYNRGEILVRLSGNNYVKTEIGEDYVQDNNKDKI